MGSYIKLRYNVLPTKYIFYTLKSHPFSQRVIIETLPLELFYDYDSDVARIMTEIRKYESGERDTPLQAKSGMLNNLTKKFEPVDVDVLAFNLETKKVQTRNRVRINGILKTLRIQEPRNGAHACRRCSNLRPSAGFKR